MKLACPGCQRLLRCYKERRFDYGFHAESTHYEYRVLNRYACTGNAGCQHVFLLIEDIPEMAGLPPRVQISEDWPLWHKALRHKPSGVTQRKTTAGAFTLEAHCNTAEVWTRILKRFGYHPMSQSSPA